MKKLLYLSLSVVTFFVASCKKNDSVTAVSPTTTTTSAIDQVKDSVFMYAQEEYLWYDGLPTAATFNAHNFTGTSDLAALQSEVNAISQYKKNPATNAAYEYSSSSPGSAKYSFVDNGQTAQVLSGNNGDFGFFPVYYTSYTDLRIRYVNPNSPAFKAGLHRGDLITSIVNVPSLDGNVAANISAINAALQASSITMTLKRNNGTSYTATLVVTNYTANPVMKDTVINTGNGRKVGYLVFSTFTSPANATPQLDAAFDYFIQQGITDLVVDLRYNGGGYVATAEYLDNLIVPASKSGTMMYASYYNNKLQADSYPLLAKKYYINKGDFSVPTNTVVFSKKKTLGISRVFFIVTSRTASASELTINNLIPEMDVQLLGSTSYGKPVGFFAIPITSYQLYIPEFETKNSAGKGGYYAGMTPASSDYPGYLSNDDVSKDFGDPTENLFSHALNYVTRGTFSIAGQQTNSLSGAAATMSIEQQNQLNEKLNDHTFNGMIFDNKALKKR